MKKTIRTLSFMTALIILLSSFTCYGETDTLPQEPQGLKSQNILLLDAQSLRTIYEKNSAEQIAPGGFTKILTAILVLESVNNIEEKVTANPNAINSFDFSHNNMGVLPNETLSVKDLLYGMLIYDAGEAANALAVHTHQSIEKFVGKMNVKAQEIGCTNSNFTNPSGIPDEKQYSTLEDISKIIAYANKIDTFSEIVKTKSYTISPTNKYGQTRYLNNTNKFVSNASQSRYYTPNANGTKTSYVSNSDCGLALSYKKNGLNMLCLTAGAPYSDGINYANEDAVELVKYGTSYYTNVKMLAKDEIMAEIKVKNGKESNKILLVVNDELSINLPKGYDEKKLEKAIETSKNIKAPINKGDALGQVNIIYDGDKYASAILVADSSLTASAFKGFINSITSIFTSPIFITIIILIIVLFIAYTILLNKAKRKRKFVSRFR